MSRYNLIWLEVYLRNSGMFGNIFERRMYLDRVQCSWLYLRNSGNNLIWDSMSNIPFILSDHHLHHLSTCFETRRPLSNKIKWGQSRVLQLLYSSPTQHSIKVSLSPPHFPRGWLISGAVDGRFIPSNSQRVPLAWHGLCACVAARRRNGQWIGMSDWMSPAAHTRLPSASYSD